MVVILILKHQDEQTSKSMYACGNEKRLVTSRGCMGAKMVKWCKMNAKISFNLLMSAIFHNVSCFSCNARETFLHFVLLICYHICISMLISLDIKKNHDVKICKIKLLLSKLLPANSCHMPANVLSVIAFNCLLLSHALRLISDQSNLMAWIWQMLEWKIRMNRIFLTLPVLEEWICVCQVDS